MGEPHELTALEQAAALASGELSATELVEHYLDRIDRYAAALGAFVTVTADAAREQARQFDATANRRGARARSPRSARPPRSPRVGRALAAVPTAIKDLTLTAGVRTTLGSAAFADFVPTVDSDVVGLMRAGGLISLGKTATSELGLSLYCETAIGAPTRNPWRPGHTAGGSSGGAAAAVAAGLVSVAQGNDGGGSLRIPASICGVVGYKPSRGLVSGGPIGFGGFGLTTNGPIARTVADAAALLDVLAVPMPGEPFLGPVRPAAGFLAAAREPERFLPKRRLRVGRYLSPLLADVEPAADVVAVWQAASLALSDLGLEVIDVPAPFAPEAAADFELIWRVLSLAPIPPDREGSLLALTRWLRERGREIGAEALVTALSTLQLRVRAQARREPRCDLMLAPVLARAEAPVGWFVAAGDPAADFARQTRFSPYCAVQNLTGAPAVSLPLGASAQGAPIGVMVSANPGADATLIAVSAMLEQTAIAATVLRRTGQHHPPIWSAQSLAGPDAVHPPVPG